MSSNCRLLLKNCRPIGSRLTARRFAIESSTRSSCLFHVVGTSTSSNKRTTRSLGTAVPRPYVDPKLSYAFGKSNEQLVYSTISRELDHRIRQHPNELAFISHVEKIKATFKQLSADVDRLTKALVRRFNIKKGDFVGVMAYNCYHWIVVQLACSRIGAVLSPINPSYKAHELAFVLKKGQVRCLFTMGPKSVQSQLNNHLQILQADQIVAMSKAKELQLEQVVLMDADNHYNVNELHFKLANCRLYNWMDVCDNDGRVFQTEMEAEAAGVAEGDACIIDLDCVSPDDLFAVYYTSGTTGVPKGACVSQFTVVNNVKLCQTRLRNARPRDWKAITATTLPMFHIFAGVLNSISPCLSNTTLIYSSHKYDIPTYVESILEHGANITTLTPTMLIDMLTYIEQKRITNVPLKLIQPGGAFLPPELVSKTFKLLPNLEEIRTGYGSTENGAVATFQTIHEPREFRALTVGPPVDFTEIRIVEQGTSDRLAPLGQTGEIQTRGHNTMVEYLGEPGKTSEVLTANKWYRTGDIGIMHPHGSIEICGRLKNMIIKGGENIYPDEVEQMMHKMDCIEKVHVVGVPDDRFGEQVCAWIKLKDGYVQATGQATRTTSSSSTAASDSRHRQQKEIHEEDIIQFCKENITYFKVPKYILFVDDFPMTPTKKVQGHIMTQISIEKLGLKKNKK